VVSRTRRRLVVRDADRALDFYRRALGAEVLERYADDAGHVVHAAFSIDGVVVSLTEERAEWNNVSPQALGGTPVILHLVVEQVVAAGRRFEEAGAESVFPIAEQYYGHREGRFRDPFGHLWILTTIVARLDPAEIAARTRGA
jgi:PhnB protein